MSGGRRGGGRADALFQQWQTELQGMSGRIDSVRKQLYESLKAKRPARDWSFIVKQIGMFSFTGMTPKQVDNMIGTHHIYMTKARARPRPRPAM